jgi:hypothetical protein
MSLCKTEKAVAALAARPRTLSPKERALLLLANGHTSGAELLNLVQAEPAMLASLLDGGYLATACTAAATETAIEVSVAADRFESGRSQATARMYLFDMSERLFARRNPTLAAHLRTELRLAKDPQSMRQVAQTLLEHIEADAGIERAQQVSRRLDLLLPEPLAA